MEKNMFDWDESKLIELANKYKTPLYVMDEQRIRKNIHDFKNAVSSNFDCFQILYASKACDFSKIYQICEDEKIGVDVVSDGEIYTAFKSGFDMSKAYFHGNSKTLDEIELALDVNVGYLVIDNLEETDRIQKIALKKNKIQKVLIRITPGIDPHTYEAVSTGVVDCKFGCAIVTGYALEVVEKVLNSSNLKLVGFHAHIGSQVFDADVFMKSSKVLIEFMAYLKQRFYFVTEQLNLGGGFGVSYLESESDLNIGAVIGKIAEVVKEECAKYQLDVPMILFEPGRRIVASAGITIYKVNSVKKIVNGHNYVAIDGGMTDNPRYALYRSKYRGYCLNKLNEKHELLCTIAGKCCESGDLIAVDVSLPQAKTGDILAILSTGAYNYSMASNYNRLPRPPIVMLSSNGDYVAVKRETFEDVASLDI